MKTTKKTDFDSRETRANPGISFLRAVGNSRAGMKLSGYAAVFNSYSQDLGGFYEKILPGAFRNTIRTGDARALWNHNADWVLGRQKSKTLRLEEDEIGLRVAIDLPDSQKGQAAYDAVRRGDVSEMSFAFLPVKESWDNTGKIPVRTLHEVELYDVSPVTFPAYPATSVKVRNYLAQLREMNDQFEWNERWFAKKEQKAKKPAPPWNPAIWGIAVPYNQVALPNDNGQRIQFLPGCFDLTDVYLAYNHDPKTAMARTRDGSLQLIETDGFLYFESLPANTRYFLDQLGSIASRKMGMSPGYDILRSETIGNKTVVKRAKLIEISLTGDPGFRSTIGRVLADFDLIQRHYTYSQPNQLNSIYA